MVQHTVARGENLTSICKALGIDGFVDGVNRVVIDGW
jgi:hypothetical protein